MLHLFVRDVKMDSELFDRERRQRGWPFKDMEVGEALQVTNTNGKFPHQIQAQCHAYASLTRKKFRTMVVDGVVWVKRIA